MNNGVPPTLRNARTGEFTPPGISRPARANSASLTGPAECDQCDTGDAPLPGDQASARAAAFAK
jgi:hypothetical protein